MPQSEPTFHREHDTQTFLRTLADRLRRDALALTGLALQNGPAHGPEERTLLEMAASLEQDATVAEALGQRLCTTCRLQPITESTNVVVSRGR